VCSAAPGGGLPELQGPKNDLLLLLERIEYYRDQDDRKITLIHDFDVTFTDSNQVEKHKSKTPTSRDFIRSTIEQTMKEAGPSGKVFFYFGGHGEEVQPEAALNPSPGIQGNAPNSLSSKQNIVVGNNERISGAARAVFVVLFRLKSIGPRNTLPYKYDLVEGWVKAKASLHHGVRLPMVSGTVLGASSGE
ncbi:hypothetical protein FRC00_004666, partial [Tulasnella sp. 408]